MISLSNEFLRKSIHLSNLVIPLFLFYYGRDLTLAILVPSTILFLILDTLRIKNQSFRYIYNFFFKSITRNKESESLTGASYVFIASTLTIILFPQTIAIAALMIMSISDTLAAIIGRSYGSIFLSNKSLEGSVSFFLSSIFIVLTFSSLNITISIVCVLVTTIFEVYAPINDNLLIPITFSGTYVLLDSLIRASGTI